VLVGHQIASGQIASGLYGGQRIAKVEESSFGRVTFWDVAPVLAPVVVIVIFALIGKYWKRGASGGAGAVAVERTRHIWVDLAKA
jgi:hypothetical protein